jgi:hypothetical protein
LKFDERPRTDNGMGSAMGSATLEFSLVDLIHLSTDPIMYIKVLSRYNQSRVELSKASIPNQWKVGMITLSHI